MCSVSKLSGRAVVEFLPCEALYSSERPLEIVVDSKCCLMLFVRKRYQIITQIKVFAIFHLLLCGQQTSNVVIIQR